MSISAEQAGTLDNWCSERNLSGRASGCAGAGRSPDAHQSRIRSSRAGRGGDRGWVSRLPVFRQGREDRRRPPVGIFRGGHYRAGPLLRVERCHWQSGRDALSSMGTICGYKAVLVAATSHLRIFPMMTTAAGTITPARVFVIGAGVAGLQAIATARRLGAVISAYDLRPAAKEQVQSLGGRFVELPIEAKDAQDAQGYARPQGEDFYRRQRELLGQVVKESDVVITAAVIPGKKSPILVTEDMVKGMAPGSVILDLAAERGGNCEITERGKTIIKHGVTIIG